MGKIGSYPAAAELDGTEELISVQSAASVKVTATKLRGYIYNTVYKNSAYNAQTGDVIFADTQSPAFTINLPPTPLSGDYVGIWDCGHNAATNNITVNRNGHTINGAASNYTLSINSLRIDFVYNGTTWEYITTIGEIPIASAVTFSPTGNIAATTVQGALAELDSEKSATGHTHSGTYEPADATILKQADVDDTPVNGVTTAPVSSNWAYDHAADLNAHGGPYTSYTHPNHSGDVTSVGDGATTIVAGAVTLAKMANMATSSLIYRKTAATGAPEVNTLATLKTDLGLTGTNSGDQTITLTGDVTGSGTGSFAATIGNGTVTDAKLRNSSALSVIGRSVNTVGAPADIAANNDGEVFRRSGTTLGFGTVATGGITDGAVTLAKMANMATSSLIYRKTAATGAPEVNTLATLKTDLGLTGTNSGDQTITLTGDVTGSGTGSFAATIGSGTVTLAKMANMATASFIGRNTASTGVPEVLSVSTVQGMLGIGGNLNLDITPASDPSVSGVTTDWLVTGSSVTFGQVLYIYTDGSLRLADADFEAYHVVAMAAESITAGNTGKVLLYGFAYNSAWTWGYNSPLFLSTTAGAITETSPTASGDRVQVLGRSYGADWIFFNPSQDWILL